MGVRFLMHLLIISKLYNVSSIAFDELTMSGENRMIWMIGSLDPNTISISKLDKLSGTPPSTKPTKRSNFPSVQPSSRPSIIPSLKPTRAPSPNPTFKPSVIPSSKSVRPSIAPSARPSTKPSAIPSSKSARPSIAPSARPSTKPSAIPSSKSVRPSIAPSARHSTKPSAIPSSKSVKPSIAPSARPSIKPSAIPSSKSVTPSIAPSARPSTKPSAIPSSKSVRPSIAPSARPSIKPSAIPSYRSVKPSITLSINPSAVPVVRRGVNASMTKPTDITFDSQGNQYIMHHDGIIKITADGIPSSFAKFDQPTNAAVDTFDNLFVTSPYHIYKIAPGGQVTKIFHAAGLADKSPWGIAFDSVSGGFYLSDVALRTIVTMNSAGVMTEIAGQRAFDYGVPADPDAPDMADGTGTNAIFLYPAGVTVDTSGNAYVADSDRNNAIRKITPEGVVTTVAGAGGVYGFSDGFGSNAQFANLRGIQADTNGNIFIADTANHNIRKLVISSGEVTTVAGSLTGISGYRDGSGTNALFSGPFGVDIDSFGNIFVADTNNNVIRKINHQNMEVTTYAG